MINLLWKILIGFSVLEKRKSIGLYLTSRQLRSGFLSFTVDHALIHINTEATFTTVCICFPVNIFCFRGIPTFYLLKPRRCTYFCYFFEKLVLSLCYAFKKNRINQPLSFRDSCKCCFTSGRAVKQILLEEHPGV